MKSWLRANRGLLLFLMLFGLFRTAIADWNPIPSGSMRPNLLEGDVVFVNRIAFDLKLPLTNIILAHTGEPQRGDIVTFFSPKDDTRLIKRLIAVPGDTVEMRDETLIINGKVANYDMPENVLENAGSLRDVPALRMRETSGAGTHRIQILPGLAAARSFGPVEVPAGQYLMLGDNRDNSTDSRYIGFVPRERLIGHAQRILVSADINGNWLPRFERTGMALE